MPSMANSNHVNTTRAALEEEFYTNGWKDRLAKCRQERVDKDYEFASNTRAYRRQCLVEHYEGDLLVAFTIEYTYWDDRVVSRLKMLLINDIPHIVP
jgi:hypothetical protein